MKISNISLQYNLAYTCRS